MNESLTSFLLTEETTGIYESLKVYDGVFFRMKEHLDRFFESAHTLEIKIPETRKEIEAKLKKALTDSGRKNAFVRLTLAGGELVVHVGERTHPPGMYKKGITLKTSTIVRKSFRTDFPEAKSTSCLNQVLATLDPTPSGNYEILFLNSEGFLTEVRIGNFFAVIQNKLCTPPVRGLLSGVTRGFVIKCARLGKISVEEKPLMRHELFNANEAFLTNTSWEILPIREVDGRKIGSVIPGPITGKLQTIFRRELGKEIKNVKN